MADSGQLRIASTLGTFAADDWHVLMPLERGGGMGERGEERERCYWSCCKGAHTRTHTHTHYALAHTRAHILTLSLSHTH